MNLTPDERERLERVSALVLNGILTRNSIVIQHGHSDWAVNRSLTIAADLLEKIDRATGARAPERWRKAVDAGIRETPQD